MVNSGFGACPPTTSTIEVGLYLSCRISGSLLGPILPAAAMAEANGGGFQQRTLAGVQRVVRTGHETGAGPVVRLIISFDWASRMRVTTPA